jgi:4,5-dihydroxyphthalate decarboxylase
MTLKLTMVCGPYDRARALIDGTVKPEGIDLCVTVNAKDPGSPRQLERAPFDAVEFYTGTYMADLAYRDIGYTAIPIFVKRMFRHSYMYVNNKAGIGKPSDLNGRRVGVQSWFTSAAIWARGVLEDEWGVDIRSIHWVAEVAEHREREWKPPSWLKLEIVKPGVKQFDLLAAGDIDASLHTGLWAPGVHPNIDFLLPDHAAVERDYFRRTGFFPIMHTLLVKNSVLERDPWVAMSLFNAWMESKQACYRQLEWERIHLTSLWYRALREEETAAAGEDFYRWGFAKSRAEVDKMLEYCLRYGLVPRKFEPEEMFHPTTLAT